MDLVSCAHRLLLFLTVQMDESNKSSIEQQQARPMCAEKQQCESLLAKLDGVIMTFMGFFGHMTNVFFDIHRVREIHDLQTGMQI